MICTVAGNFPITVYNPPPDGGTSNAQTFTVNPGLAFTLDITTQPAGTGSVDDPLTTQPVVNVKDQYGNNVADGTTVTASLVSGTGTLRNTTADTAGGAGNATFANLGYDTSGEQFTVKFTANTHDSPDSALIGALTPGATAYFDLGGPATVNAGSRAAYTVTRYDQYDNQVTSGARVVYLFSNSTGANAKFYDAAIAGSVITQVTITDTNSSADFWYYDNKAGNWTITASDATPADGPNGIGDDNEALAVYGVHNITSGLWYPTIQGAINAANPGDTIVVATGTYAPINIDRSLTLQAGSLPVIDGGGATAVTINADTVTLTGFGIQNTGPNPGILVSGGSGNAVHFCNIDPMPVALGLNNTSGNLVDAENNWWDDASGPQDPLVPQKYLPAKGQAWQT